MRVGEARVVPFCESGTVTFDAITISRTMPPVTDEHYCPRCELRFGTPRTRWFSERVDGWQVYRCVRCEYEVKDR